MYNQSLSDSQHQGRSLRQAKGFTMIELLVVVAIIGALAAIAVPAYYSYVNKAKLTVAISTMSTIRKTLESFSIDNGEFPEPPIDFTTGLDNIGRTVFPTMLLDSINNDLLSIDSYTLVGQDYTVKATAKDSDHTVLTLTPQTLNH